MSAASWRVEHEKRLHAVESTCELMMQKLYQHDDRFEGIENRLDSMLTKDDFYRVMDKFMEKLETIWQEQIFLGNRVERIENRLGMEKTL